MIPEYFRELIEDVAFEARGSEFVDQKSGVSARMTIALLENVISNVERRCLQHGDGVAYPRLSDLHMALPAITGKLELVYEGEQEGPALVARKIIGQAVRRTFRRYFPKPDVKVRDGKEGKAGEEEAETSADETSPYAPIVRWFSQGNTVETADDLVYRDYAQRLAQVDGLRELAEAGLKIGAAEEAGPGDGAGSGGAAPALDGVQARSGQHHLLPRHAQGDVRPDERRGRPRLTART